MAKVLLEHITKKYGDVIAVNDLNLDVRDKEFLVLVGPSGCGKSTALRMIAGLEEISSGNLYIGDRLVNEVAPKDRDIAMVFQSYALYPHMTVFDNLAFGLRLRKTLPFISTGGTSSTGANGNGSSPAPGPANAANLIQSRRSRETAIRRRVEEVANSIELGHLLNRKPNQLSGGQRQRVALGRAIVRQPAVFLMDEPLSNLDAKMRVSTRAFLQKLHRALGVTTIYVTHDQVEALTMGDRIAVMKDGVLQQIATPKALFEHPTNLFVATFIGSPSMNLFDVDVEQGGEVAGLFVKGPGFRARVPEQYAQRLTSYTGKQIIMGLRPEAIHDARFDKEADPTTVVDAQVDLVEPLGSDVILFLLTGEKSFIARMDDRTLASPRQSLRVVFDMENMHAFDPTTERALL
jgi:multiple sugar transport system ATP-binding protein